jgi:hypothetical protein
MTVTILWDDIPDPARENFLVECGALNSVLNLDEYHKNMAKLFAECKAYEFHENPAHKYNRFDKIIFENVACYNWFLMRFL